MRILLTGVTGFLGGRVAERLADDHDLFGLGRKAGDDPRMEWIEHDLAEPLRGAALPGSIDAVAHLAQSRRYGEFPDGAADVFAVNVRATADLIDWARLAGAARFVFVSTGGVYDSSELAREDDALAPRRDGGALSHYVNSKLAAEALVASYAAELAVTVLRPFWIYGPGQSEKLIAQLARRAVAGEAITVKGNPGMRLNPIYVDDAARAVASALLADRHGCFNVAGGEAVTMRELAELVNAAAGGGEIESVKEDVRDLVADTSRMRDLLGAPPETTLEEGVAALVDWLRAGAPARA